MTLNGPRAGRSSNYVVSSRRSICIAASTKKRTRTLNFTVDAALLRELGERLVGQAHIALAELIKNGYDADATLVEVEIDDDAIMVVDNGHGMDPKAFRDYWMRIGSPHKDRRRVSRRYGRPLTGSKGVGRLASQFLSRSLRLETRARGGPALHAEVDWDQAIDAGELTSAKARVREDDTFEPFPQGFQTGTRIVLTDLKHDWDPESIRALAQELWPLQPPFPGDEPGTSSTFRVSLSGSDPVAIATFNAQMSAILGLWQARITGRMPGADSGESGSPRTTQLRVDFADGSVETHELEAPGSALHEVEFEIRVFDLRHRQPSGIAVERAREYLRRFGGVHVYDAGFHLPYYGPDTDWLRIEQDHAHRLSRSELLPEELQVPEGMNYLPTNSRLYGVVRIDTGSERTRTEERGGRRQDALGIQVSRDRLIVNQAYRELVRVVRTSLDFYATRAAARAFAASRDTGPSGRLLSARAQRIEEVAEQFREQLPEEVYADLRSALLEASEAVESESQQIARQASLLGALATAGISAIAYEHEASRQFRELEKLAGHLRDVDAPAASQLREWIRTARATRSLFTPLLDESNRETTGKMRASSVLDQVAEQASFFLRRAQIDLAGVDPDLRLPEARFTDWAAIFQNVFVNSANAMLDSEVRVLDVRSRVRGRTAALTFSDTGSGVDLESADALFEPFERRQRISTERRNLGAGGTGLGLTIARMIATNLGCTLRFVKPADAFSTAIRLAWSTR